MLGDVKNKELLTLLRRERAGAVGPTVQEQINARRTAEQMIGQDENMYRILWVSAISDATNASVLIEVLPTQLPQDKVMQIQLLAKDDASTDDAENMTERWKQYMASYVLVREALCEATIQSANRCVASPNGGSQWTCRRSLPSPNTVPRKERYTGSWCRGR